MAPVIHIRTEVRIKASAEHTFRHLIDTSTWPEWNSFVPEATTLDKPGKPLLLSPGSRVRFFPIMKGKKFPSVQEVTTFDHVESTTGTGRIWRICWIVKGYPHWLLRTQRFNEVEEFTGEGGPECVYRTGEDQSGPLAWIVKWVFGAEVEKGIKNWATDLKRAMEDGSVRL